VAWLLCTFLLQDKLSNALSNITTLDFGLGYNLGKGLSKSGGKSQLVKCKNTRLYLQLYIPIVLQLKDL